MKTFEELLEIVNKNVTSRSYCKDLSTTEGLYKQLEKFNDTDKNIVIFYMDEKCGLNKNVTDVMICSQKFNNKKEMIPIK